MEQWKHIFITYLDQRTQIEIYQSIQFGTINE